MEMPNNEEIRIPTKPFVRLRVTDKRGPIFKQEIWAYIPNATRIELRDIGFKFNYLIKIGCER